MNVNVHLTMMKQIAVLLLSLLSVLNAQDIWERIESPTTMRLAKVHFVNAQTGWAAGDSGLIIRTTDGGDSWESQDVKTSNNIVDIFFLDQNFGWALTWEIFNRPFGTTIHKTTDGGKTWENILYQEENFFMRSVFFLNPNNGWLGGNPHALVNTLDGGFSWRQAAIDSGALSNFPVSFVTFYDDNLGFASGGRIDLAGVIWQTTNAGRSWAATPIGPEPITSITVLDSNNVVGLGGDFKFGSGAARSTNGGKSWNYETLNLFGIPLGSAFRTPKEGWAVLGVARSFLRADDAGFTWRDMPTPDFSILFDISFGDSLNGFAVGDSGVIYKYRANPVGIQSEIHPRQPADFRLLENYPNPFNPSTMIRFKLNENSGIDLSLFSVNGQFLGTLKTGNYVAGSHEFLFHAEELPAGVYFLRLTSLTKSRKQNEQTLKIILLK